MRLPLTLQRFALALVVASTAGRVAVAQETQGDAAQGATTRPAEQRPLTVAVVDFDATKATGTPELGREISELLTVTLSSEPGFVLVDRDQLERAVREQELSLSGVVDVTKAVKVGQLVNAQVLVTGSVFPVGEQVWFFGKMIGTETSRVEAVVVRADKKDNVGTRLLELATKVVDRLHAKGKALVAGELEPLDPVVALKKRLDGRKLPKVVVHVTERDLTTTHPVEIDPAAETELGKVLGDCGFTVVDDPRRLTEAEGGLFVSGEAFSEPGPRISNLVTATARVELKVTDPFTQKVFVQDRQTSRAVDLSDAIAGKSAIEKAAHLLAIRLAERVADTALPPAKAP